MGCHLAILDKVDRWPETARGSTPAQVHNSTSNPAQDLDNSPCSSMFHMNTLIGQAYNNALSN